jgi:hypothetical protein
LTDIDTRNVLETECSLNKNAGARKVVVWRKGRIDDHVDLVSGQAGALKRLRAGLGSHLGAALTVGDPASLFDPSSLDDPLVRGLHQRRQLVIGDHPRRNVGADAQDTATIAAHHG